jgi:hypothetical protein
MKFNVDKNLMKHNIDKIPRKIDKIFFILCYWDFDYIRNDVIMLSKLKFRLFSK